MTLYVLHSVSLINVKNIFPKKTFSGTGVIFRSFETEGNKGQSSSFIFLRIIYISQKMIDFFFA